MISKRFVFLGRKEQLPEIEAALKELGVTRKSAYLVLKYLAIAPHALAALEQQFPDV